MSATSQGTSGPKSAPPRRSIIARSINQNRGFYGAILLLAVLYIVYNFLHPRGFTATTTYPGAAKRLVFQRACQVFVQAPCGPP